jgi:hypothetical protein
VRKAVFENEQGRRREQGDQIDEFMEVVVNRVTRLDEFMPIGRLFTLGRFLKIADVDHILGCFFPRLRSRMGFDQNGFGLHFGHLTIASGHPECEPVFSRFK